MFLSYPNKKSEQEILYFEKSNIKYPTWNNQLNKLFHGENLYILKLLLYQYNLKNKIDLIYIDPPFATNNIFKIEQERANTISMSANGDIAYSDKLSGYDFIEFLRERLIIARELLSEQGSIYLHIDYKIGHYIKLSWMKFLGKKILKMI